jgi:hypothetical protein
MKPVILPEDFNRNVDVQQSRIAASAGTRLHDLANESIRVAGIDYDAADPSGIVEADIGPSCSGVGRFVHAIPRTFEPGPSMSASAMLQRF